MDFFFLLPEHLLSLCSSPPARGQRCSAAECVLFVCVCAVFIQYSVCPGFALSVFHVVFISIMHVFIVNVCYLHSCVVSRKNAQ